MDYENMQNLFTPFKIGKVEIKNRLLVGPMGMSHLYDEKGVLTDNGVEFYTERARGGWGAIFTGAQLVDNKIDPPLAGSPLDNPGGYFKKASVLNERVNAYGAKMFAEISFGPGRNYPGFTAPSAVDVYNFPQYKGRELTVEQIKQKTEMIVKAAAIMKKSGFAGVDIHSLHWGYMLDEFVLAITNKREDEYGGSLENRMRLVREAVGGIKQVCGADFPVTIGLGVKSFIKGLNKASLTGEDEAGRTVEESIEIAKMLQQMGVDAILTDTGVYDSFYYACPPSYMPKGHGLELYKQIKDAVDIPVIARSRMGDPELCSDAIRSGKVDAVMMARPALADPYLPRKVETGKIEQIRPCIGCNMGCISAVTETGKRPSCAVNPRAADELFTKPKKSIAPRKIAVVGGGAAGMQAAITAAECGHDVELFEKTSVLGGELNAAGAHSFKIEIHQLRDWFIHELDRMNIPVHMSTELNAEAAVKSGFDTVILATGASPVMPKAIPGIDKAMSAVEVLAEHEETGKNVIVVGGGMVGCELAVDLAKQDKAVTLVEALPDVLSAEFVPCQHKGMLKDMMEHYNVNVMTGHKLAEVTDNGIVAESVEGGAKSEIKADNVIISIGLKPNPSMRGDFYGTGIEVYEIGSAKKAGNVITAVHEAFEVVYNFD